VEDEQEALEMALKRQANRRSLNDAEIYHCIETFVTRYGNPPNGGIRYTVREIADRLGISKRKAERTMRIMAQASEETKEQVKSGSTSINKAEGNIKSSGRKDGETNEKPKTKGRACKTVKIDADQWEELKEIADLVGTDVEDTVYEAIALYLDWELDETEELPSEDFSTGQ
jgi:hypothetical protein